MPKTKRISFRKIKNVLSIPNLLQMQKESFEQFKREGIHQVLAETFPIKDVNGKYELYYESCELEEPKMTPEEAKAKISTYSAPLKGVFRLLHKDSWEVETAEVFMGEIPYMTDKASFIYNGVERVIVSQIVRSPGIYFEKKIDKKNGKITYLGKIMPTRGAWLHFELDAKGMFYVKINKNKRILGTAFLKAIGVGDSEALLELFEHDPIIANTLEKDKTKTEEEALIEVYKKSKPNEIAGLERAKEFIRNCFFDSRNFDLAVVGRVQMNKKLMLKERVSKKVLARDVKEFKAGSVVNEEVYEQLESDSMYIETKEGKEAKVIGNQPVDVRILTKEDIIAAVSYLIHLDKGIGQIDNIDHLGNRRVKLVGELLQTEVLKGIKKVEKIAKEKMNVNQTNAEEGGVVTPHTLIHTKPLVATMREFLGSGQLSQLIDQINPLAEISNKNRLSALGPGGLNKARASIEARDVHRSHYGKICPIETPEGSSIGLIGSKALYAGINSLGFFVTPYRKVTKGKITEEIHYLTADEEDIYYIAQASELDTNDEFVREFLTVRHGEEYPTVNFKEVDYVDVSAQQIVSIAAALIPFLENDDANRALMGANMQRQAVPLLMPSEPIVGTGIEGKVAVDTGSAIVAEKDGIIRNLSHKEIIVGYDDGEVKIYPLQKFFRTNANTCYNHYVRVVKGQRVEEGDVLADSTTSRNGELALGRNCLVAFMTWEGYNYEDAILVNERLVREDGLSSVIITEEQTEIRDTKQGRERITRKLPNINEEKSCKNLDEEGIIRIGAFVKGGDVLVGKVTPKSVEETSATERILEVVFAERAREVRDTSLKMPNGKSGVVIGVNRLTKAEAPDMNANVSEIIKVNIAQLRKLERGDKMAGRHGNKGVIAKIMREEDMPYLPDGRRVDIVLNPLGVPSRMNIGQIMETHLGMAGEILGVKFETPVFDGAKVDEIHEQLQKAGLPENGKFQVFDGRTGEPFENEVTVGVMYMIKLNHQVKDKWHARSVGPYSLITQQPMSGKAQMGGQRLGEMEVWALEAYGAAHILQEMLTVKSDDLMGRRKVYDALVTGQEHPEPSITEAVKVIFAELKALGLDIEAIGETGESVLKRHKKKIAAPVQEEAEEEILEDEDEDDDDGEDEIIG